MADHGVRRKRAVAAPRPDGVSVEAVIQEFLSATPAGCTWLLPVTAEDGQVVSA
jgi:hypothetical protein